jgi:D-glycero-alpha-D-manno-heptose-7-phosphate kinase
MGRSVGKRELAGQAIHVEQNILREAVGSQDQVLTCYGGINRVQFHPQGEITVEPVCLTREATRRFNRHFLLFFTGFQRVASDVAATYVHSLDERENELRAISGMVESGLKSLVQERYSEFGALLDEYWRVKRGSEISCPEMDWAYQAALDAGAWGGKLVGAGGGGYLLLFAPPEKHRSVRERLGTLLEIPFEFEFSGSQIIFFDEREEYE